MFSFLQQVIRYLSLPKGRKAAPAPDISYVPKLHSGPISDREKVVERLKGQKILVPDILSLLRGWRCDLQPDIDAVNEEIDIWLKTYV